MFWSWRRPIACWHVESQIIGNCLSTMEARLVRRPVIDLIHGKKPCLLSLNTTARRHESSTRRSKHRLNIKPDASFISNNSPQQDHVIFNPPSSAPSALHTPLIFLPKEDKRKQLFATPVARPAASTRLPPVIPKFAPVGIRHHLKDSDIAEIQRLRSSDPEKWTALRLSKKFNCSKVFIQMCAQAPEEKKERDRQKLEIQKARWGPKKTMAREDRLKRRELALKDL